MPIVVAPLRFTPVWLFVVAIGCSGGDEPSNSALDGGAGFDTGISGETNEDAGFVTDAAADSGVTSEPNPTDAGRPPDCDDPAADGCPLKILFLIDGSGSQQFMDRMARRADAVDAVVSLRRPNADASFAIVRFNQAQTVLTRPNTQIIADEPLSIDLTGAFTRDSDVLASALQGLRVADSVTDTLGVLRVARELLRQDMAGMSALDRQRTRYAIILLTDGEPFPRCCSASSEGEGRCQRDAAHIAFCDVGSSVRQRDDQLPFLRDGQDYNLLAQIVEAAQGIDELGRQQGVRALRLHTAFLLDEMILSPSTEPGCLVAGAVDIVCPAPVRVLLQQVAEATNGTFREYATADAIDFDAIVAAQLGE